MNQNAMFPNHSQHVAFLLIGWGVIGLVMGTANFFSHQSEVEEKYSKQTSALLLPGKAHDDFVKSSKLECVDNQRKAAINQQLGVTEPQIKIYCDCVAEGLAKQISTDELKVLVQTGKPTDGLSDKVTRIGATCSRAALGNQPRP